ncbi:hemerythrin domain-containing protein [Pseudarthrobacter sp. O4]|uniref:hemerythrin domain-containing protein n=1 Tax=Pseudarthrobacter sp. O4 TaxID=3418417 RepID=UPI003CEC80B0
MDESVPRDTGPRNPGTLNSGPRNPGTLNTAAKDTGEEAGALEAVEQHHGSMLKRLNALVFTLTHAVKAGDAVAEHDAHEVLVEWCETELVPHSLAEEGALYGGAGDAPEGKLLVEGMLAEHQVLAGLAEDLRGASGVDAAVAAGAIRQIFAVHVDKANRLLLPLIVASPGLSLAQAVGGLSELVGDAHVRRSRAGRGGTV